MAKRSFAEFAAESDPNLTVITADGGRIPAHYDVLRLVCSCLRDAPASDTWDLSSLLVDGGPVSQETVMAVLEVLYSSMWALGFEAEEAAGQYSLAQLLDMLLFADAVGCSKHALNQLAGLLGSRARAALEVAVPAVAASSSTAAGGAHRTGVFVRKKNQRLELQQAQQLQQQVAQQLEALLFVGFKLDLQQLLQPALHFLRANAESLRLPTQGSPTAVFSLRVLAAASGASGAELLSRACLQQPLGLGCGIGSMFGDVEYKAVAPAATRDSIMFEATLQHDLYTYRQGMRVLVKFDGNGELLVVCPASRAVLNLSYGVVLGPEQTFKLRS
ncbi:hypothetical protein COO60DRAFT_1663735 [Scenedesmus sp. NREL 46B-D3]|nr:hypothetical protein COO60DRAFT_1663735 [Scenedesmus sp. NREL 46B-D3]